MKPSFTYLDRLGSHVRVVFERDYCTLYAAGRHLFGFPNRSTSNDFCCSTFANYIDRELTRFPDLTNPINPIIRKSNFSGQNGKELSRNQYDILKPSLQLASLLLESDPMAPFLVKMFHGDLQTANGISISKSELRLQNPDGALQQVWDVNAAFYEGQDMVKFKLKMHPTIQEEAVTVMVDAPLQGRQADFFQFGRRSEVWLNNSIVWLKRSVPIASKSKYTTHRDGCTPDKRVLGREYLAHYRTCDACSWPPDLLAARMSVVIDLIHEFGHCCQFAAYGVLRLSTEIPQSTGVAGETGLEIWSTILGGTPLIASDHGDTLSMESIPGICNKGRSQPRWGGPIGYLEGWPNFGKLQLYRNNSTQLESLRLNTPTKDDVFARIPLSYFESLFTQAFWDKVALEGLEAMRPPMVGKWYFRWQNDHSAWVPCDAEQNHRNMLSSEQMSGDGLWTMDHSTRSTLKRKRDISDVGERPIRFKYGVGQW